MLTGGLARRPSIPSAHLALLGSLGSGLRSGHLATVRCSSSWLGTCVAAFSKAALNCAHTSSNREAKESVAQSAPVRRPRRISRAAISSSPSISPVLRRREDLSKVPT
jgi:hypothetical protein